MANKVGLKQRCNFSYVGSPLCFCDDRTVIHAAGNTLVKLDILEGGQESFIVGSGVGIGAFAVSMKQNVICYSEKGMHPNLRFADLENGTVLSTLTGGTDLEFEDVAFSTDGVLLASLGGLPDFDLVIWDWSKGHVLAKATVPGSGHQISFNPSTRDELCISGQGTLVFVRLLVDQEGSISINFHKPGAVAEEKIEWTCHAWDAENHLYCGTRSGQIWKFDPSTGNPLGQVMHVASTSSIRALKYAKPHLLCASENGVVRWFDLEEQEECYAVDVPKDALAGTPDLTTLVMSSDQTLLTVGFGNGCVFVIQMQGQIPQLLDGGGKETVEVTKSDMNVTFGLMQHDDVTRLTKIADYHRGVVSAVANIANSDWIVTVGEDGMMRAFSVATSALISRRKFKSPLTAVCTIPNTRHVAIGDSIGVIRVVELPPPTSLEASRPRLLKRIRLHRCAVVALKTSPSGYWISSVAGDGNILFINTQRTERDSRYNVVGFLNIPEAITDADWTERAHNQQQLLYITTGTRRIWRITPPEADPDAPSSSFSMKHADPRIFTVTVNVSKIAISASRAWCTVPSAKRVCVFDLPEDPNPAPADLKDVPNLSLEQIGSLVTPLAILENHLKLVSNVAVSTISNFAASAAADGLVQVYEIGEIPPDKNTKPKMQLRSHDSFKNGVNSVGFTSDGSHLVVGGTDGGVVVCSIGLARLGTRKEKVDDLAWGNRDDCSDDEDERESTVVESKMREVREVEEAVHAAMKNSTRNSITVLKNKLQSALSNNEEAPDIEKMDRKEFIVDVEAKNEMEKQGLERVVAIEKTIHSHNLGRELVWNRIKSEVWDSMESIGLAVVGFDSVTRVNNFPLRKPSNENEMLDKILSLRKTEKMEAGLLRKEFSFGTSVAGVVLQHPKRNTAWSPPPEEGLARLDATKTNIPGIVPTQGQPSATQGQPSSAATQGQNANVQSGQTSQGNLQNLPTAGGQLSGHENEGAEGDEGEGDVDTELLDVMPPSSLGFARLDVTARQRRIMQYFMIRQDIAAIKRKFNGLLNEMLERKRDVLHKIEERNVRINEIVEELKTSETLISPSLQQCEAPETILAVQDSEVTVDKWVDESSQGADDDVKHVDKEAEEAVKRALKAMMGGTLDSEKDIRKLDQQLIKPSWMSEISPEEMTDEQQKAVKEFESADKALREEKDKYRKTLESEMKKLRAEQTQLMTSFDESLNELSDKRFDTEYTINKLELYGIKLMVAVHKEEELKLKSARLEASLIEAEDNVEKQAKTLADHKIKLERQREHYEQLVAEDKGLERQLRREITEAAGEYAEVVRQSFTLRPDPENEDEWLGEAEPCPFGVDEAVWQKMLQGRDTKMNSETRLREGGAVLNSLQTTMQELQEEYDDMEQRLAGVQTAIQAHKEESVMLGFDRLKAVKDQRKAAASAKKEELRNNVKKNKKTMSFKEKFDRMHQHQFEKMKAIDGTVDKPKTTKKEPAVVFTLPTPVETTQKETTQKETTQKETTQKETTQKETTQKETTQKETTQKEKEEVPHTTTPTKGANLELLTRPTVSSSRKSVCLSKEGFQFDTNSKKAIQFVGKDEEMKFTSQSTTDNTNNNNSNKKLSTGKRNSKYKPYTGKLPTYVDPVQSALNIKVATGPTPAQKKKFDLQESLKKKLTYKPHSGSLKPSSSSNTNNNENVNTTVINNIVQTNTTVMTKQLFRSNLENRKRAALEASQTKKTEIINQNRPKTTEKAPELPPDLPVQYT